MAISGAATLVTRVALSAPAQGAGSVWDAGAACESGGNWTSNTGNGYYGGLQFSRSTWNAYGGTGYAASANLASQAAQIATAQRVLAAQGPGAWPTCGRRAGLTRANGGAATTPPATTTVPTTITVSRSSTRSGTAVPGKLAVDGVTGPMTTRAIQRWVGTTPDGAFAPMSKKALPRTVGVPAAGPMGPPPLRPRRA